MRYFVCLHKIELMKYWILLFGLLFIAEGLDAQKRKGVEYSTDVLMFAPPAAGFVKSLVQKDYAGMKQLMLGAATNLAACYILKYAVKKERPDHSDNHAFPSNHTSVAFQGAAFLQKRYGWKWGIPAYLLSAYVGWGRTYCKQHDWWDVLGGMVIGIGAAYIYTHPLAERYTLNVSPSLLDGEHPGVHVSLVF